MSPADLEPDLRGRKILLICARFFGYEQQIAEHLRRRGAQVAYVDERPGNSTLAKALIRLRVPILRPWIRRYYRRRIAGVGRWGFDDILVISPECCDPSVIRRLRASFPAARIVLYMWDSCRNKLWGEAGRYLRLFDRSFTFDDLDARTYGMEFLPLFFSRGPAPAPRGEPRYAFSFVGTIHSDRFRVLRALCEQADRLGLRYFVHFYLPSRWLFFWYKLTKPEFRGMGIKGFRFRPLVYAKVQEVVAASAALVDVEHPGQRGLTMRTMEVLGSGRKLMTTNGNIRRYRFFDPDRILVLDRLRPQLDPAFFQAAGEGAGAAMAGYTLQAWVDALLLKEPAEAGVPSDQG